MVPCWTILCRYRKHTREPLTESEIREILRLQRFTGDYGPNM
jgi:hypothetical protein